MTLVMVLALAEGDTRAQALGVHPHIAPINQAAGSAYSQPAGTPQFNVPDGVWNHGEGFRTGTAADADYGGHLGGWHATGAAAVEPGLEVGDIFDVAATLGGPQGWQPYDWYDRNTDRTYRVRRFVGYLRPGQLGPYPAPTGSEPTIEDAAFQLFAPDGAGPFTDDLVVVLNCWGTSEKPVVAVGGRFAYPGRGRLANGLVPNPDPFTAANEAAGLGAYATVHAPAGVVVISGDIVPRIFGRPAVFDVQRIRELRRAVELLLQLPDTDPRHPPGFPVLQSGQGFACLVYGGSYGGMTSQLLGLIWPNEFQGVSAHLFGASLRRVMADQFNLAYMVQRGGFAAWGGAYYPEDTLEWGTTLRIHGPHLQGFGWDYFNASVLLRLRRQELFRPYNWLQTDEDTIGQGTDYRTLLSGVRAYDSEYVQLGPPVLTHTTIDRRGHAPGWHLAPISQTPSFGARRATLDLLPYVHLSWSSQPVVAVPQYVPDDGSEDSYAWVHDRDRMPDYVDDPPADPLVLDASFGLGGHTAGHGLSLGLRESLCVAAGEGLESPSIYAGDADGVVTRYVLNPTTLGLDAVARSVPLGYGAFALAVGELEGGGDGPEVVVGTKNDMFVLDGTTLQLLPGRHVTLGFEHTSPSRVQIADVFAGPDYPGNEIVFTSLLGHLVVFSSDGFNAMTDLGEPGIEDLAVLAGVQSGYATTDSRMPLLLLSHRGHLAHVTCNKQPDPTSRNPHPAQVQAWTVGEHGLPADLEIVDAPVGGGKVAVAAYRTAFDTDPNGRVARPIMAFDALTLQPASMGTHGIPEWLGWSELLTVGSTFVDIAPVHAADGQTLLGFVLLLDGRIVWVPLSGTPAQRLGYRLDGFPPAARAVAVTTADLCSRSGGEPFHEEVILSTLGGHVVWFHLQDMLDNGSAEYLSLPGVPAPPSTIAIPYTNATLAGTWGMVAHDEGNGTRIFAANQSGELFDVDPVTGSAMRRAELRQPSELQPGTLVPGVVTAPIRDLVHIGQFQLPLDPPNDEILLHARSGGGAQAAWLETRPWQNASNDVLRPFWARDQLWDGEHANENPILPVESGFAPFVGGGHVFPSGVPVQGATRQLHWWGGDFNCDANLVQGLYLDAGSPMDNWCSTKDNPPERTIPPAIPSSSYFGSSSSEGKDLRNCSRPYAQAFNHGSVRIGQDAFGPVVVAATPGGSVVLLRPGAGGGAGGADHGTILWPIGGPFPQPEPVDDGYAAMGLAVRPTAEYEGIDIFVGIAVAHLDPAPALAGTGPGNLAGGIRWLRWHGTSWTGGAMDEVGSFLFLDPGPSDPRGGYGVCGLAIGDVVASSPGDELVATTLEGDLYVYGLFPELDHLAAAPLLQRSWVRGTLGVNNAILIFDADGDARNELFIAGSQGIWKWRQP
ncbi:MAG: hypothetical protein IPM29_21410 [Planctomycetes bacterium]|nr:hypothetical protein [Planctomycetota bacterium]